MKKLIIITAVLVSLASIMVIATRGNDAISQEKIAEKPASDNAPSANQQVNNPPEESAPVEPSAPISAPITAEFAGRQGAMAAKSVVRVICKSNLMGGTGFVHKSGKVISAAHVVLGCPNNDIVIITPFGKEIKSGTIRVNLQLDLSLITPVESVGVDALPISKNAEMAVGSRITAWGFPGGYNGSIPLLTVGYLAGIERVPSLKGVAPPARWVVNAAFNRGNSGGPVLNNEGEVVGVVTSKLVPIPEQISDALHALANQHTGFTYTRKYNDGRTEHLTEGQIIAEVLEYLRGQTQLVIGYAVTSGDLVNFLKKEGVE